MKSMLYIFRLCLALSFVGFWLKANTQNHLPQYISEALRNNLNLQKQSYDSKLQQLAVTETKAQKIPSFGFESRFSYAGGGRLIELPLGDLVNPAYSNLNIVNGSLSGTNPNYPSLPNYPVIENQRFQFLRETDQESKFRLTWPIFNMEITKAAALQEDVLELTKLQYAASELDLIVEIKIAYLQYLAALESQKLFESTRAVVNENLRVSKSLLDANRTTIDQYYAAESQVKSVESQIQQAVNSVQKAQYYFNLLINRDIQASVKADPLPQHEKPLLSLDKYISNAKRSRIETRQIESALQINESQAKITKAKFIPNLTLVGDYGIQGERVSFDKDDDFFLGSALLSWKIFSKADKIKIEKAALEKEQIMKDDEALHQMIVLQVSNVYSDLLTAEKNIAAIAAELKSAEAGFEVVKRKYEIQRAQQIEFIDARNRMTTAELRLLIARYQYWTKRAELQHVTGQKSYKLE